MERGRKKRREKDTIIRDEWIDPFQFPYFDRFEEKISFTWVRKARLPAQAIPYSCNIELLLFYHRLDLIRGKFHL